MIRVRQGDPAGLVALLVGLGNIGGCGGIPPISEPSEAGPLMDATAQQTSVSDSSESSERDAGNTDAQLISELTELFLSLPDKKTRTVTVVGRDYSATLKVIVDDQDNDVEQNDESDGNFAADDGAVQGNDAASESDSARESGQMAGVVGNPAVGFEERPDRFNRIPSTLRSLQDNLPFELLGFAFSVVVGLVAIIGWLFKPQLEQLRDRLNKRITRCLSPEAEELARRRFPKQSEQPESPGRVG